MLVSRLSCLQMHYHLLSKSKPSVVKNIKNINFVSKITKIETKFFRGMGVKCLMNDVPGLSGNPDQIQSLLTVSQQMQGSNQQHF